MSKVIRLRTCLGCGDRAFQGALLRLALDADGEVFADESRRAPGRGGYLHRDDACWERFARRKGPVRSLHQTLSRGQRQALVTRLRVHSAL